MSASVLNQKTYLPDESEAEVGRMYDFLQAHEAAGKGSPAFRYFLAGPAASDRVEIPVGVYEVLRQVVDAMRQGLAVTIAPQSQMLSTQQAADLLGVSRPTLVKLLNTDRIPFERTGTHRRVLLRDILAYRQQRREEQYAALEATAISVEDQEDLESTLRDLRKVRRDVAARRRDAAMS
jgi:excisionase family DNA binding protein